MIGVELTTARLLVRSARIGDGILYARYYRQNRDFLQPFSPRFESPMFSERDWEASMPRVFQQFNEGTGIRFLLFREEAMIGVANLSQMSRSPNFSAVIGYTLDESHQGQGYMKEALTAIIDYAFHQRNLHRIRADYMPRNERSGRLLRSLNFNVEGYARDHLLIDGRWEDHILTARINEHWRS